MCLFRLFGGSLSKDCALRRTFGLLISLVLYLVVEFEERNLLEIIGVDEVSDFGEVLVTHIQKMILDSHFVPNVQLRFVALE